MIKLTKMLQFCYNKDCHVEMFFVNIVTYREREIIRAKALDMVAMNNGY